MDDRRDSARRRKAAARAVTLLLAIVATAVFAAPAQAAKSAGCVNAGYRLVNLSTGAVVAAGTVDRTIPAATLGAQFAVRGTYNEFIVRSSDFAVFDWAFTGVPNPEDITGGVRTPVFASKVPDHRGLTLTSDIAVFIAEDGLEVSRAGFGVSMKIQAKDCATGGIYQAEPQRDDGTRTRFVHTLATSSNPQLTAFYYDNPNFRARVGDFLGDDCQSVTTGPPSKFCVQVATRVNISNDFSKKFVARDSAQVATRVAQADCNTATPLDPSARHCGGVSVWDVASGGRMGFVTGQDATEVANPPTVCTLNCQAQNRVRGRLANLGFPFPVPAGSRFTPRVSAQPLPPLTGP
jgi:hypothetical protein